MVQRVVQPSNGKNIFVWVVRYANLECKKMRTQNLDYLRKYGVAHLLDTESFVDKDYAVNEVVNASFSNFDNEWRKAVSGEMCKHTRS